MKILHTLERHRDNLMVLQHTTAEPNMAGFKYLCVVIDGPESFDRKASWASSFNDEDTHKLLCALAEQTKA